MKCIRIAVATALVVCEFSGVHAADLDSFSKGKSLCKKNEKVVTSFRIDRSEKTASICEERNGSYLVYRFGTRSRIELQYPSMLDATSWERFEFEPSYRQATLKFENKGQAYGIHQKWNRDGLVDSVVIVDRPERMALALQAISTQGRLDSMDEDFVERRMPAVAAARATADAAAAAAEAAFAEAEGNAMA